MILREFLHAAWTNARIEGEEKGFKVIPQFLRRTRGILYALIGPKVSREILEARLNHCSQCPIFNPELKSCGFYVHPSTGELMGCGCYMALKARAPESRCWLWDRTYGKEGWPTPLNDLDDSSSKQLTLHKDEQTSP